MKSVILIPAACRCEVFVFVVYLHAVSQIQSKPEPCWTGMKLKLRCFGAEFCSRRIWPLGDLLGVFPDDVVLAEDEQGAVHGQAVLFHWDRVVDGHGPGSLGHGLLVDPRGPR